jgi:hypothetical protein
VNAVGGPWLTFVLSLQASKTAAIIAAAAAVASVRELLGIIGTIRCV